MIGSASTSVQAAAGISSRQICRVPVPVSARRPSVSPRMASRASAGNRTVATATLNIPCGSMYSRNAASIARGTASETVEPSAELMNRLKLMRPRLSVIGSISASTWRTRGSLEVDLQLEDEAEPAQHRQAHDELHERPGEHADRVGVHLVRALEVRLERDEQADDHDVPDQRRERRDREVVVGVEDPDEQAVEAEQQDDRKQHLRQPDHEVVEVLGEVVAGVSSGMR